MADLTKTVEIVFGGKDDLFGALGSVGTSFNKLDAMVSNVTGPLAGVADKILKIDAALAALAIGGMALAIKESSNFNNSFALISTSITATGDNLAKYRDDVLKYSTTSTKSLDDINASLYTAAQAGVKYQESIEFIGKAEQLAVANKADLNKTVDLLTGTMNAYGFTIKDVGHLNDVFFQSTLIGKQTIDDLGISMGQVVGIAANSGVSFEALSAAIATLTAKGLGTENAITAVKGVITSIISPSKEAADAAKALGLNFSLTELTSKGFANMLTEIMVKTGGSKEKLVDLFSEVRAMNGVLSLTGDGMKFFNDAMQQITNSAGASEEAFKKMVGTFQNQSQMVINTAKGLFIDVGTQLEPIAAKVAGSFGGLLAGVKLGIDQGAFDPLFEALKNAGDSLSLWLQGVARAMPEALSNLDFTGLIAAFSGLGDAIGKYFGGLDLTKTDDLAEALQTIVDIITGLIRVTEGMAEAFRPFVVQIAEFFIEVSKGGPEMEITIGKILAFAKAIETMSLAVVLALAGMQEFGVSISGSVDATVAVFKILFNFLTTGMNGVQLVFEEIAFAVVDIVDKMTMGLIPQLGKAKENIRTTISGIVGDIRTDVNDAKDGFTTLGDLWKGAVPPINAATKAQDDWNRKVSDSKTVYVQAGDDMETLGAKIAKIVVHTKDVTDNAGKMSKALTDIPTDIKIGLQADGSVIEKMYGMIIQRFPNDETGTPSIITNIKPQMTVAQWNSLIDTKTKIDKIIPAEKEYEIKLKLDEAKIKEQSAIVQKSMEWKAKLDIAEVEAATKKFSDIMKGIDNTVTSTGTTLASMVGTLGSVQNQSGEAYRNIQEQVKKESERRDDALAQQKKLTEAEVDYIKEKTKALSAGSSLITIDGKGLQPHLEAFMFEVLAAIQVKANAEGMKLLVGLP